MLLLFLLAIFPLLTIFLHNFGPFFWGRGLGSSDSCGLERRGRKGRREWAQFAPHRLFFLFFGAFLNGLFMRGRSIIHTLFKIETERARQREEEWEGEGDTGPVQLVWLGRKRGQDMRAKRKCAHLFILFRFRFDISTFLFVPFFVYFIFSLCLCVCVCLLLLLNEIFKWFARKRLRELGRDEGGVEGGHRRRLWQSQKLEPTQRAV